MAMLQELDDILLPSDEMEQVKNESLVTDTTTAIQNNQTTNATAFLGIGGQGGVVYDVNRLKRNLVQETVRNKKMELWDLLGKASPSDDAILEDKLAALVQSNPVSTTTDSNLLDGGWTYAFASRQTASALLDPNRFDIALKRNPQRHKPAKGTTEGFFRSSSRDIHLENVQDDEDSYVVDQTRFLGGLLQRVRRYHVGKLTRTTLHLDLSHQQWWVFQKCWIHRENRVSSEENQMDLRILYLDSDLCICTSDALETSPFHVYTKSEEWGSRAQRVKRDVRLVMSTMTRIQKSIWSVLMFRKRLWSALRAVSQRTTKDNSSSSSSDPILMHHHADSSQLTVLKIGGLSNNDEDEAWDGEDDPFVHLTADERQAKLKQMKVRDVERAGRKLQQRKAKEKQTKLLERRKNFKKPD